MGSNAVAVVWGQNIVLDIFGERGIRRLLGENAIACGEDKVELVKPSA